MTEQHFEIKAGPRGLGAYATALVKPGALLLAEPPLLRINTDYYFKFDIEALFAALPPSKQEIYLSLSSAHGQPRDWYPSKIHPAVSSEERKRIKEQHAARRGKDKSILSVFMTNAMDTGDGAAVFERASRFNHCCVPNASFAWNEKLGVETIYATKEIEPGEEITISYCDPFYDYMFRKHELRTYGFECDCIACGDATNPQSFAAKSRERRWRLREITDRIYFDDKEKLESKLEAAALLKEEGLITPVLGNIFLDIARLYRDRGDMKFAVLAAEKALGVYMICLGKDGEETEKAEKSVRAFKKQLPAEK